MTSAFDLVSLIEITGLQVSTEPGSKLRLRGTLAAEDAARKLGAFLRELHEAAIVDGLSDVEVDLTELRFMSSSGIRSLLAWISWIREEPYDRRYRLVFVQAADAAWQQVTLEALQTMGNGTVAVRVAQSRK
jgi:hypothetical protein